MINMKVEPLGKKSEEILDVVKKFESPSTISMHLPLPCVWKEGEGCYVKDPDGNTYLDFSSGIAVLNIDTCNRVSSSEKSGTPKKTFGDNSVKKNGFFKLRDRSDRNGIKGLQIFFKKTPVYSVPWSFSRKDSRVNGVNK